jgi:dihydrofolate reductase
MNSMPKYVVSSTLRDPEWTNSTVIDLEQVESLEGNVLVAGSMTLVRSLFELELVDELRLLVYPVVLGTGKRLFGEQGRMELTLTKAESYATGVVNLTYRR